MDTFKLKVLYQTIQANGSLDKLMTDASCTPSEVEQLIAMTTTFVERLKLNSALRTSVTLTTRAQSILLLRDMFPYYRTNI